MNAIKILIIDDEETICDACRLILSDVGYHIENCPSGREGLDRLSTGEIDLVLLDMKLPDMNGMEILRAVKSDRPEIYVIVMTGYSSVKNAVDAIKLGAFDYLSKPFDDDELLITVQRAAESKRLKEENLALRRQLSERFEFSNIIGENPAILKIFEDIRMVAPTDSTVLLTGESGTGKELFARTIHAHSKRASRQFIAVDCNAFSLSLLESELFGHVKGAFTGAIKDKPGIFEAADHGTLFLDEVGNLDMDIQAKLLRVMETQEFRPVGAGYIKKSDVRIIAATNRDLKTMSAADRFREDFFYRLNVFPIFIPPLRERKDDIPRLAYHFLRLYCRQIGRRIDGFSDEALEMLVNHNWPGNIRELKNVVERLVIVSNSRILDYQSLWDHWERTKSPGQTIPETLDEFKAVKRNLLEKQLGQIEKSFIQKALQASDNNITRAAQRVGMQRSNFSRLMKKHRLSTNPADIDTASDSLTK